MVLILGLMAIERHMRNQQSYHGRSQSSMMQERISLKGLKAFAAFVACLLPALLGFGVPLLQLLKFTLSSPAQFTDTALYSAAANSINVAIASALICVLAAFVIVYAARRSSSPVFTFASRVSSLGYAIPGTILGLGILVAMTSFDNWLSSWMQTIFDVRTGLLISGSLAIVIFGCSVRFLAIAIGNIEAGYSKISPNLSEAARTLGHSRTSTLWLVELPMISKAAGVAGVLVFVESMKELSTTLLLRPFNFDTLSTYVYTRASRAVFEDASLAALMIVLIGLVPVYVLTTMIISEQSRNSR
jgi:iron(III) transport system permease protein